MELALKERPDVIIMDIVMPELNGIDATLAILKEWPEAKIVILTSYLDNEKIYPCLRCRCKVYFKDPRQQLRSYGLSERLQRGEFAIETEVSQKVESRKNHAELHDDLTARNEIFWLY